MLNYKAVFDADVPEHARDVLLDHPDLPAPWEPVPRPRFGGRGWREAGLALIQAPLWVYLPATVCWGFGRVVRGLAVVWQVAVFIPIVLGGVYGLAFNTLVGAALQLVAFCVLLGLSGGPEWRTLLYRHRGRYVRPQDLDPAAHQMLHRAQTAVDAVFGSRVNGEGMLDDVHNAVTLPHHLWEIAQTVAELSRLRAEQARGAMGLNTPRVAEALKPRQRALALAAESVRKRIEALEAYAARVHAADEALLELEALRALAEGSDDYTSLLARTVRDELAVAEIDGLAERARLIEEALHASVEQARRAGLSLVPEAS